MPRVPAVCASGIRPMIVSIDSHPSGVKLAGRRSVAPLANVTTWPSIASRVPLGESAKPPATLAPARPLSPPPRPPAEDDPPGAGPPVGEAVGGTNHRPDRPIGTEPRQVAGEPPLVVQPAVLAAGRGVDQDDRTLPVPAGEDEVREATRTVRKLGGPRLPFLDRRGRATRRRGLELEAVGAAR